MARKKGFDGRTREEGGRPVMLTTNGDIAPKRRFGTLGVAAEQNTRGPGEPAEGVAKKTSGKGRLSAGSRGSR